MGKDLMNINIGLIIIRARGLTLVSLYVSTTQAVSSVR